MGHRENMKQPTITFSNGHKVPQLGFGTWPLKGEECYNSVKTAIEEGFRHIDTAYYYMNEPEVGRAIKDCIESGIVTRKELCIQSKVANHHKMPGFPRKALEATLEQLGLDYVDIYLIHCPWSVQPNDDVWSKKSCGRLAGPDGNWVMADIPPSQTWKELEELVDQGKIISLGFGNFSQNLIQDVLAICKHRPQTNQVERNPFFTNEELNEYCKSEGIVLTAYGALGYMDSNIFSKNIPGVKLKCPDLINNKVIKEIAEKYKVTPAQLLLRFHIDDGLAVLARSANPIHIKQDAQIVNFEIEENDMKRLHKLNFNARAWTVERSSHSKYFPKWNLRTEF